MLKIEKAETLNLHIDEILFISGMLGRFDTVQLAF